MRELFFKKTHKRWYVDHQGRMIRISEDKEKSLQPYHELKVCSAPASSLDSVASLLNSYLEWCRKKRSERTYVW